MGKKAPNPPPPSGVRPAPPPAPPKRPVYLTTQEVAERLNVTSRHVTNLITRGELKAYRFGRNYSIRSDDLQNYENKSALNNAAE